jgi:DNA (cytosine-5)-methyltransferase 1
VFVVGHLGDWKPAAEVLFESESLSGDIKKGRSKKQNATRGFIPSVANTLQTTCNDYSRADGFNMIAFENSRRDTLRFFDNVSNTLQAAAGSGGGNVPCVSYALQGAGSTSQNANGSGYKEEQSFTLNVTDVHGVSNNMAVRRLTPVECERLQGFPDNYTNIPKAADGNRYKALGNSMAVPVMRWIGERINQYEQRGVA